MQPCEIIASGECSLCGQQLQRIALPVSEKLALAGEIESIIAKRRGGGRFPCRIASGRRAAKGELRAVQAVPAGKRTVRRLRGRREHRALQAELRGRDVQLRTDRAADLRAAETGLQGADRPPRTPLRSAVDRSAGGSLLSRGDL